MRKNQTSTIEPSNAMSNKDDPSYERFKNVASGIQSYAVAGAFVIGGLWALVQFFAVSMPQLKKGLFVQAQLIVKVTGRQERLPNGERGLVAVVDLTNTGSRNVFLDYRDHPLCVTRLVFDKGTKPVEQPIKEEDYLQADWEYAVLRSGETDQLVYVVRIREPGLYAVHFRVPLPPKELEEHDKVVAEASKELGNKAPKKRGEDSIYWQGSTVVNIGGPF